MDAGDRAGRGARLGCAVGAADVLDGVRLKRNPGRSALLRAVVDESVLAHNIDIAGAGPAIPLVRPSRDEVVLEERHAAVSALGEGLHLLVDTPLGPVQRLELAVSVVDDADRGGEAQFEGPERHGVGVAGVGNARADHGVDVHVEVGVLGKHRKLHVEHPEALHRGLVGLDVVDADLQVFQSGVVEAPDALGTEQISVRDQARDDPPPAHVPDEVVELRMQHRLAATQRDDADSKIRKEIDPPAEHLDRNRLGDTVVLIAVRARDVAASRRNQVRENRVVGCRLEP